MNKPPDGIREVPGPNVDPPKGRVSIYRLAMNLIRAVEYEPIHLAQSIEQATESTVWFCDTNMFLAPTDDCVWNALLKNQRLYLIPGVYKELAYWLKDPKGINLKAHKIISQISANKADLPIAPFQFPDHPIIGRACEYYVNLLAVRKRVLPILKEQYREEFEKEPSNQELSNYCQKLIGERGLQIAKDGFHAMERGFTNFYTDEELVTTAFIFAIITGRETIILSRDEDIQEQFMKLKTRMADHYCSMALADRFVDDPGSLTKFPMPMDHPLIKDYFLGQDGYLFVRPDGTADELVPIANPNDNKLVPIHCWIPREQITQNCFLAETQMQRLLILQSRLTF